MYINAQHKFTKFGKKDDLNCANIYLINKLLSDVCRCPTSVSVRRLLLSEVGRVRRLSVSDVCYCLRLVVSDVCLSEVCRV